MNKKRNLVPIHISKLKPYIAGKRIEEVKKEHNLSNIIKLSSNENPLGSSPLAIDSIKSSNIDFHRYPDSSGYDLRKKIANKFEVKIENVILGNGSEGIMSSIMRTFLSSDDEIISSKNSFIGFRVLANASGIKTNWVPMENYKYDLPAISKFINDKTKLIYLANPDNPTGTYFNKLKFDDFMKNVPKNVLVILDEAYFEYAKDNEDFPDSMFYRYDNVITLRTFSKIYGLASLRIGYGFAHERLINNLMKVKLPFEPSTVAQLAAISAIDDDDFMNKSIFENKINKIKIYESLKNKKLNYIESATNFVTLIFKSSDEAKYFCDFMLSKGIILRNLKGFGIDNCIRISIGNNKETNSFLKILDDFYFNVT